MKLTTDHIASFTWGFNHEFFLETDIGNFVWSDPDYQGDNTIRPTDMDYGTWVGADRGLFGRDKGKHRIGDYCGEDVKILDEMYHAED